MPTRHYNSSCCPKRGFSGRKMHAIGATTVAMNNNRYGMARAPSRANMDDDANSKARVRVYRFGEHLNRRGRSGAGTLAVVPNGERAEFDLVRGMLVRAAYAAAPGQPDFVDLEAINYEECHIYLLPDGEEIYSPGERSSDCWC